jgi:hypothetical protein
MKRPGKDAAAFVFLLVVVTLFFSPELFTDRTLVTFRLTNVFPWLSEASEEDLAQPSVTSDCTFSYYPRRVFATRMIRQGEIPFWNPHQFCGTPFLANFQSAVFYPVNLLLYGFEPTTQMDLFIYIHFLIAAAFSFLLARKLGLSSEASVVSAVAYTFCGFMVTRYGQPTFISTASWLPAVLYFAEHLIQAPGLRRAGLLGLAVSLCIMAGFPQLVMLTIYTLLLYVIMRLVLTKAVSLRWKTFTFMFVLISVVVACLVCAFQLLPTYELSKFSYRKELPYEMILSSAHHKLVSLKYLMPDILGNPADIGVISKALHKVRGGSTFSQNYVSTTGYVGILPLLLALLGLSVPRRRMLPFVVLSAVALLVVFGTGLLALLYRVIPGFNFSRVDRVIVIYMASVSILAGCGFDLARSGAAGRRNLYFGLGFVAFAIGLAVWLRALGLDAVLKETGDLIARETYLDYASGKIALFLVIAAFSGGLLMATRWRRVSGPVFLIAAIAILMIDLLPNGLMFKVSQPASSVVPQSSFVEEMKTDKGLWRFAKFGAPVIPSNTATLLEIDDIHGYDALNVNHYIEVLGAIDSTVIATSNAALRRRIGPIGDRTGLESKVLDLLNVKHVLSVLELPGGARHPVGWVNVDHLPRAFLVNRSRYFDTFGEILAYMKGDRFDPASEVLLRRDDLGGDEEPGDTLGGVDAGTAEIVDHTPNTVDLRVNALSPCYLVVSDVYFPGWRVFIDGEEGDLLRADYAFRAVRLDPGVHIVRMTYLPGYFRIGVIFSGAGIALLAVLISSKSRFSLSRGGRIGT